jgi:hypothetical protein
LTALGAGGAALPFGCAGTTGSDRFPFYARVGGVERDASVPFEFDNERGWRVRLTQAELTLGPVYLNTVAPLRRASRLWGVPFVREARAHESHLGDGNIVGEVLAQATVDLLSPELVTFPSWGTVTRDEVRTLEVCYYPSVGQAPDVPGNDVAALRVAGRATRGAEAVAFRGQLVLDDSWRPGGEPGSNDYVTLRSVREVRGVPAAFVPTEGGWLELRVNAAALLRSARFESLEKSPLDADGATRLLVQTKGAERATDQVLRSIYNGVRAATGDTYAARWRDA